MQEYCPPDLTLRPYRSRDFDEVAAIWEAGMRRSLPFLGDDFIAAERAALRPLYLEKTRTTVAAGATVHGFVSVLDETEIAALFVATDVQRCGIGRMLLDHVRGDGLMTAEVMERNLNARAFYHRYGFRETGSRPHPETGMTLLNLVLG